MSKTTIAAATPIPAAAAPDMPDFDELDAAVSEDVGEVALVVEADAESVEVEVATAVDTRSLACQAS